MEERVFLRRLPPGTEVVLMFVPACLGYCRGPTPAGPSFLTPAVPLHAFSSLSLTLLTSPDALSPSRGVLDTYCVARLHVVE